MAKHARLPASQTKQFTICHGYIPFLEAYPERRKGSGSYAQLGTCAHELVERCAKQGELAEEYEGRLIEIVDPNGPNEGASILKKGARWPKNATRVVFEVDLDMYEAVQNMLDYVYERCFELELITKKGLSRKEVAVAVAELVAQEVIRLESWTNPFPGRDDTGGTADMTLDVWPIVLEIVDYKHGQGVFVPVEANDQLRSYLKGTFHKVGGEDYQELRYTICQPRHQKAPPDGIMSESVSHAELIEWGKGVEEQIRNVDLARKAMAQYGEVGMSEKSKLARLYKDGFLSVGEDGSHCTFCDLADDCPAAEDKAQELAGVDFDDLPEEPDPPGENRLAVVLPWVPFLDRWLKNMVGTAEALMFSGGKVDGQKVVRKKSSGRKWITQRAIASEIEGEPPIIKVVTEKDIVKALVKDFGLNTKDLFTTSEFLTAPAVEKLLPKDRKMELEDKFMRKPPGGLTIAPEDDPRPAVTIDPGSDFDDLE